MYVYVCIYIGQEKKDKESLNNNNIIFQLVSGRARPQGSMFEKMVMYIMYVCTFTVMQ